MLSKSDKSTECYINAISKIICMIISISFFPFLFPFLNIKFITLSYLTTMNEKIPFEVLKKYLNIWSCMEGFTAMSLAFPI